MQRPRTSEITLDLAREIGQREGVKAIVDSRFERGTGYAISVRLVPPRLGSRVALYQETANTPQDLCRRSTSSRENCRAHRRVATRRPR